MKHLKVIACETAFRELCFCASQSNTVIDFTFMPRKLHVVGAKMMHEALQDEIDKVNIDKFDAILMGYGLCGGGVVGLKSKLSIVIPKAFYFTSGWLERKMLPDREESLDDLISYKSMINDIVFLNTGVGNVETYRDQIKDKSIKLESPAIEIEGDNSLLFRFINGDWNEEEFTVIPANYEIIATNDDKIIGYK